MVSYLQCGVSVKHLSYVHQHVLVIDLKMINHMEMDYIMDKLNYETKGLKCHS